MPILRLPLAAALLALLVACGGGGGGGGAQPPETPAATVTVSGAAEYESVPNDTTSGALNYNVRSWRPIRGATVDLVNSASGATLASTTTSDSGSYSFTVANPNGIVLVRVRAEIKRPGSDGWDVTVRDNTNADALYVVDSETFTPAASETRAVRAASGWGGSGYTGPRSAAPFAILDVAWRAVQALRGAVPATALPPLQMFWSRNNLPTGGNTEAELAAGRIGTTFYMLDARHRIYVLGAENTDTDEYDSSVVAHEFGHYVVGALGRDDSIGGDHNGSDRLDMRVAFGEGFADFWSAVALNDPRSADSLGLSQATGFVGDVSIAPTNNRGWYAEDSVSHLLWQFRQSAAIGLTPMFEVLMGPLRSGSLLLAAHAFFDGLKAARPAAAGFINAQAAGQAITLMDAIGTGETNHGNVGTSLPVYHPHAGAPMQVCVSDSAGEPNKLGNYSYIRFSTASAGARSLSVNVAGGTTGTDPDFQLVRADGTRTFAEGVVPGSETLVDNLPAGTHTVVLYDFNLLTDGVVSFQPRCFVFNVQ